MLHPHFHEDFESDPKHARRESIPSNDFREIFAVHGRRVFRIRHGYEQPHANFIARLAGLEKDAGPGNADRTAQVFKGILVRIGRTDAHELRNLAAAAAAALRM